MPTQAAFQKLHKEFLAKNHPQMMVELRKTGELQRYLTEIGEQAMAMYETIAGQMEHNPNLPQEYGARVAELEQIPIVATEIVLHDLIYQPAK